MQIAYQRKNFKPRKLAIIEQANQICESYEVSLTLRQVYYQFVARGLLDGADSDWYVDPVTGTNNQRNYNRLGEIINDARLAGLFDWDYMIDRTRNLVDLSHWRSPETMIEQAAEQFRTDLWAPQKRRAEVWIEKDAAIGVIERVCRLNDVPFFSCRGYVSQSEMWAAAARIGGYLRNGEQTRILHIGDHDPSGLDMSRDIADRLRMFINQDWINEFRGSFPMTQGGIRSSMIDLMRERGNETIEDDHQAWDVKRIALTYEQIEEYAPPPNYAKTTDARFQRYFEETGLEESWELDALDPMVMEELIQTEIDAVRDEDRFAEAEMAQEEARAVLIAVKDNWEQIRAVHAPSSTGGAS